MLSTHPHAPMAPLLRWLGFCSHTHTLTIVPIKCSLCWVSFIPKYYVDSEQHWKIKLYLKKPKLLSCLRVDTIELTTSKYPASVGLVFCFTRLTVLYHSHQSGTYKAKVLWVPVPIKCPLHPASHFHGNADTTRSNLVSGNPYWLSADWRNVSPNIWNTLSCFIQVLAWYSCQINAFESQNCTCRGIAPVVACILLCFGYIRKIWK